MADSRSSSGSSPWLLGMMAVALLLLEIAVGDLPVPHEAAEGVAVPPVPNPLVEEHHAVRAWE
eukprot:82673-Pyramimonas_sp.AAC.1